MTEISDYITNDYKAIDSQETIAEVQNFFEEVSFSHFSVLNEGIYMGCIASDDVETFDDDKKVDDYTINGYYQPILKSHFLVGMMVNNSLNVNPSEHLYIGLELGLGFTYIDKVNDIKQGANPLVQGAFKVGYRF